MCISDPLPQIISSIDEIIRIEKNEVKEGPNDEGSAVKDVEEYYQKAAHECKTLPNSTHFGCWHPEFKHGEMPRLVVEYAHFFIPQNLSLARSKHPPIAVLLFLEKLKALLFFHLCNEGE